MIPNDLDDLPIHKYHCVPNASDDLNDYLDLGTVKQDSEEQ